MPADEWRKAKHRDTARRIKSAKRYQRSREHHAKMQEQSRDRLQSADTILWFGKHKGKSLSQIKKTDKQYLIWLCENEPTSWRLKLVVQFLKDYLASSVAL